MLRYCAAKYAIFLEEHPLKILILTQVKAIAYPTLVQLTLEYATMVWDPYQQYLINITSIEIC